MVESTGSTLRVKQLYTYPIKSLRGISLPSLPAMYTGFPHDRRFMLYKVNTKENMHVSHQTEMCLFTTAFTANQDGVVVTYTLGHTFDNPNRKVGDAKLEIPLSPETEGLGEVSITMHYSPCVGFDMGTKYNAWFSERFGYEVKLLYIGMNRRKVLGNMPPTASGRQSEGLSGPAQTNGNSWFGSLASTASSLVGTLTGSKEDEGVDEGISFADVAPYLIVSEKSWQNTQRRLPEGEEMDITKFRPNIIVEGAEGEWEEDFWAELRIGSDDAKIILTQNCARCNSLNVDYATGKVAEGESGKILKKLQSDRRVDLGAKWSPVFGRYGFLARVPEGKSAAVIKVGDEVKILKRNRERTRFVWPNLSTD